MLVETNITGTLNIKQVFSPWFLLSHLTGVPAPLSPP